MTEIKREDDFEKTPITAEVRDVDITNAMGGVLTEEQQKLIEDLDKESSVRKLSNPLLAQLFYFACIGVTMFHVWAAFKPPAVQKYRAIHVAMMLVLGFIMYPFSKKSNYKKVSVFDWIFVILSLMAPIYVWLEYEGIIMRAGNANRNDMIMATILVVLVLEASRRMSGWALPILSIIFIAYGLWGRYMPGIFGHRGYTWLQLSNKLFPDTEGIYGSSVSVAASFIYLFILFGAVMAKSGMGAFFNDIAMSLAGHTKGGPAKVSVISSGLLGSINGSAVANVVTTGAFTIPLMKRTGYSREFAGAVEAASSVGGQLLPPVMGAAAFIMAEILSVKYSVIIVHAAIPALLYYLGIIIQVHLRAGKLNLVGIAKDKLPKAGAVMRDKGHLLIPICVLLYYLLFSGKTVVYAAVVTIVSTVVVSMLRPSTSMSFKDILDACADGAKQTVSVAMACACVGIVVGVISKTGFGFTMANAIITLGAKSLLLTLLFTMVTCMILGMGVPSIPAYIITSAIAAPALAKLGIPVIAAHMFAFYFAMFANLTPPVALAAFAAAGLSGGNPMKTGWASVKLAIAGFLVPYMFIYSPQLLLIDTPLLEGIRVAIGACVGVLLIGSAVEGYLFTSMEWFVRIVSFAGALCLIDGGLVTDLIGAGVLIEVVALQYIVASGMPKKSWAVICVKSLFGGITGLFIGMPLSYQFQAPIIRDTVSLGKYIEEISRLLTHTPSPYEGTIAGSPAVLAITCLVCAAAGLVIMYAVARSRSPLSRRARPEDF
ncbi:MAG: TRAP transporter permease [Synergistaceae bacterium]|jgi:TRAP transporter 4TM/12TM fusion protein|nr:TRAP transporter permease [Synergistaceae bacterium]